MILPPEKAGDGTGYSDVDGRMFMFISPQGSWHFSFEDIRQDCETYDAFDEWWKRRVSPEFWEWVPD